MKVQIFTEQYVWCKNRADVRKSLEDCKKCPEFQYSVDSEQCPEFECSADSQTVECEGNPEEEVLV